MEKYYKIKGNWKKINEISAEEEDELLSIKKRFSSNHKGEIIIYANLKEKHCTKNRKTNAIKILAQVKKEKWRVIRGEKRGFNSVDLVFDSTYEANKCLDRYEIMEESMKRIDVKIFERNLRTRGIVKNWDIEMPLSELLEAIDDKRTSVSRKNADDI